MLTGLDLIRAARDVTGGSAPLIRDPLCAKCSDDGQSSDIRGR
jgi:hypothetical protein